MDIHANFCAYCGQPSNKMCQRCYESYCSVNCQIAAWPKHKFICNPVPKLVSTNALKAIMPPESPKTQQIQTLYMIKDHPLSSRENWPPLRRPKVSESSCHDMSDFQYMSETVKNNSAEKTSFNMDYDAFIESLDREESTNSDPHYLRNEHNRSFNNITDLNTKQANRSLTDSLIFKDRNEYQRRRDPLADIDFSLKPKVTVFKQSVPLKSEEVKTSIPLKSDELKQKKPEIEEVPKKVEDQKKSSNRSTSSISSSPERPKTWTLIFPFPENEYFNVIIQYISEAQPSLVWVIQEKHFKSSNKLLADTNRSITDASTELPSEKLKIGALVAAPFEEIFYRAVILQVDKSLNTARVRLIDYGNEVDVGFRSLKCPISIMKNLNAYAFCIRCEKNVEIGAQLSIKVIGKEAENVYIIEEQSDNGLQPKDTEIPKENVLDNISLNSTIMIQYLLSDKKYAIALFPNNELDSLNLILESEDNAKFNLNEPPKDDDFVAGKTVNGWKRGIVMGSYNGMHILYCTETAQYEIVSEVKVIPKNFANVPIQSILLDVKKVYVESSIFDKYFRESNTFTLKPLEGNANKQKNLNCYLVDNNNTQVAGVLTRTWYGKTAEINVDLWSKSLEKRNIVRIVSLVRHAEIFIRLEEFDRYGAIFNEIGKSSEQHKRPNKDDIVLALRNDQYIRAKVLEVLDSKYKVVDIDSGEICIVLDNVIKKANSFVKNCPIFTAKVTLSFLEKVQPMFETSKAVYSLQQMILQKQTFILDFDENMEKVVELFFNDENKFSLNKQLLPLLFEKYDENEIVTTSNYNDNKTLIPVGINEANTFYKLDDIEIIPIPTGENIKILVLDDSTLSEGIFTACDSGTASFLEKLQDEYSPQIQKYCADPSLPKEYSPSINEIVCALFDSDLTWYRALCLRIEEIGDKFEVLFLDYGNLGTVQKKDIRKITQHLLFPSNANTCILKGFKRGTSEEELNKLKEFIFTYKIITADSIEKADDEYIVQINSLITEQ